MKRLDRLILGEVFGPWAFGVAMFTMLIMAGQFLFIFTDYAVKGISPATLMQLTLLVLPGVLAKTFPMAVLLAALLAFGRLSGESEITAMKAAGISLYRIMRPVALFGILVGIATFCFAEFVVPNAAGKAEQLQREIKNKLEGTSLNVVNYPIRNSEGKLDALIGARNLSFASGKPILEGVTVTAYGKDAKPSFIMLADTLEFRMEGKEYKWELTGGAKVMSTDGISFFEIKDRAWPSEIPRLEATPDDITVITDKNQDRFSMARVSQVIAEARKAGRGPDVIGNLEYGYWNHIAIPLAALVYALVGAPLGIRNHRTGVATGFWMAVLIIFGYMMLANVMSLQARGGLIPAWVASFTPTVVGLIVAAVTIKKKN